MKKNTNLRTIGPAEEIYRLWMLREQGFIRYTGSGQFNSFFTVRVDPPLPACRKL